MHCQFYVYLFDQINKGFKLDELNFLIFRKNVELINIKFINLVPKQTEGSRKYNKNFYKKNLTLIYTWLDSLVRIF